MGRGGAGKTSMRSIIFANYIARDTRRFGPTFDVEHSQVRFLGNLNLNLWDCGGQDAFMENYFASQRDHIFRNVEVLIYVFDVESREVERDLHYYQSCLEAILQHSKDAKIFALIHKMDLLQEDQREIVFREKEAELKKCSLPLDVTCFKTSIWDETLYKVIMAVAAPIAFSVITFFFSFLRHGLASSTPSSPTSSCSRPTSDRSPTSARRMRSSSLSGIALQTNNNI